MSYRTYPLRVQSLVFNTKGKPTGVKELYYKGESIRQEQNGVEIEKGGCLDLFTYFNLFNFDKWSKYTRLDNLLLQLNAIGTLHIVITRHILNDSEQKVVYENTITCNGIINIPVQSEGPGGLYSIKLKAIDKSIVKAGGWYTNAQPLLQNSPRIALIICTYKREFYLFKTLNVLRTYLPENWNVFVIDNGRTISGELTYDYDERFHFFQNPNTGGSGGFTRGLMEVMNDSKEWTHALFMDDDVVIEPAALERTHSFVNMMRPEYKQHFISGSMLRMDTSCIQHESGAYWNGVRVKHCKHNYDLTNTVEILKNENENTGKNHYAAWWYCVVPINDDLKDNLPVPLFVNGDDIEYSMRSSDGIICLNGITIWHEPFHIKYNPVKQHYLAVRNGLIINTRHNFSFIRSLALVYLRLIFLLLKGNKPGAALVLNGFADFLKGPDFLFHSSQEQLFHKDNIDTVKEKLTIPNVLKQTFRFFSMYPRLKYEYQTIPLNSAYWNHINRTESEIPECSKT